MKKIKIHEKQNLIRLYAEDGFLVETFMVTKIHDSHKHILNTPILLHIHGLLGHFLARGTPKLLPHALLEDGYNSLSINTRLASAGQITGIGIFDNTIKDIDAAVEFLNQEGFNNIFILGYSLGASMVVNWAANRQNINVKGIILEGVHHAIPDSWKKDFHKWGSSPSYEEIFNQAKEILGNDPYNSQNDETFVVYQSRGPDRKPISSEIFTYKTWWFMSSPEAHRAMAYKHIEKIKIPILMLRGEGDFLIEEWEPAALAEIARKAGNKNVRVRQISGAKHDCMENPQEMIKEITDMFKKYSDKPSSRS